MSSAEHPAPESPAPEQAAVPAPAPAPEASAPEAPPAEAVADVIEAAAPVPEPVAEPGPEAAVAAALEGAAEAAPEPEAAPGTPELSPAEVGARLAALFPALFAGPAKPIKLRVHADIQARAPGQFTKKSLSIFFHRHTTSTAYLRALSSAPTRLDLDGQPAGEIADEHRNAATVELERRRGIVEAKRQAEREARKAQFKAQAKAEREQFQAARAQQQAQRAQHEAERAQRDADFEARRERSALLRAFETSTLTKANFCALKGIPEAELDARLAQAREERAARPPRPEFAERRPPPGDRPRGDRPHADRPHGDRPHGDRPQGDRPHGGPPRKSGRPRPPAR